MKVLQNVFPAECYDELRNASQLFNLRFSLRGHFEKKKWKNVSFLGDDLMRGKAITGHIF